MAAPIYYPAEMVRTLADDGNRYEVVRGELLVPPAPRLWHQRIVRRLVTSLSEYLRRGVPVCCIVDPDEHSVEVWTPDDSLPRFERERLMWQPAGAGTAFELELLELFKPI